MTVINRSNNNPAFGLKVGFRLPAIAITGEDVIGGYLPVKEGYSVPIIDTTLRARDVLKGMVAKVAPDMADRLEFRNTVPNDLPISQNPNPPQKPLLDINFRQLIGFLKIGKIEQQQTPAPPPEKFLQLMMSGPNVNALYQKWDLVNQRIAEEMGLGDYKEIKRKVLAIPASKRYEDFTPEELELHKNFCEVGNVPEGRKERVGIINQEFQGSDVKIYDVKDLKELEQRFEGRLVHPDNPDLRDVEIVEKNKQ